MKKIILFLGVCSVMVLLSNCSNEDSKKMVEIPDANFKAYLLENFDKNNDGNISEAEAKKVKEINCSGKDIEIFDGIGSFVNLTSLNCSDNLLESLDLRKNQKINKLVCTGNKEPLVIYIGMSSQLRNPNIQKPKDNQPPASANMVVKPLDDSKCTYDKETTQIMIYYDE